jgi:uncharacterized membrane protein YhaH (DUF805 family)
MKGKILDYSIQNSSGIISGEDGNRYKFSNSEWKSDKAPKANQKVDFEAEDTIAKQIYLESSSLDFDADTIKSKFSNVTDSDIVNNSPLSWYVTVLKKYATFSGRAQRAEYWYFILFNMIATFILMILDAMFGTLDAQTGYGLFSGLYTLAVFIPNIAVSVRRLHDIGKSGWWLLIALIPLIGAILLIIWFATDSKEDNQYGENPKKGSQTNITN